MTISASARSTQAPVSAAETWSASVGPAAANTVTRMPTPTRAAEVMGDVDEAAGDAGVAGLDAGHAGGGQAAEAEALTEAEDDHRDGDAEQVGVSMATRLTQAVPISIPAQPTTASPWLLTRSRAVTMAAAITAAVTGQERESGLERAEAGDALQVLGHEEEEADQRAVEEEPGAVGAGAAAVGEQPQREQRLLHAGLVDDEAGEQHDARRHGGDRGRRGPADVGGVHDAEHQRGGAERRAQRSGDIQPRGVPLRLVEHARGGDDRRDADGDVEQEPVAPGQGGGQHAAEEQPGRGADTRERAVRGHRPHPLRPFGEVRRQQRERRGRERGGADALRGAGA